MDLIGGLRNFFFPITYTVQAVFVETVTVSEHMDGAKYKYDNQSDIYMRITFFFFLISF